MVVDPFTHERLFSQKHVRNALSIMAACGMYDWSGEFMFRVGIPALSGRGGGIMAVIPNLGGFCTWSPRLDKCFNSVRGVTFYCELIKNFNFHGYETLVRNKMDPTVFGGSWGNERICNLLNAASKNDLIEVKKELSFIDINSADYDNRTALHVAAEKGHKDIVRYLISVKADINKVDNLGNTPKDITKSKTIKRLLSKDNSEDTPKKRKLGKSRH